MKLDYEPPSLKDKYENEKWLVKKYGKDTANKLLMLIGFMLDSENAYDIYCMRQYFMAHMKNDFKNYYELTLDKKRSKWRVLLEMIDENGEIKIPGENEIEFLKSIKEVRMKELTEHYGKH